MRCACGHYGDEHDHATTRCYGLVPGAMRPCACAGFDLPTPDGDPLPGDNLRYAYAADDGYERLTTYGYTPFE